MKPTLRFAIALLCLLFYVSVNSQTCSGATFPGVTQPSTCTYTYTSSGWIDSLGLPSLAPTSNSSSESICIMANYTGNMSFNFRGTLYVGPGVTYTGSITSFGNTATIKAAGTITFTNTPGFNGNDTYIGPNGTMTLPGTLNPAGDGTVHNAGTLNVGGDLNLGGQAFITNYPDASVIVQGNSLINAPFNNCGLFELFGSLTSGGNSGLNNLCSTYIHTDMSLNADYINEGLMILDGSIIFGSETFYNNGILIVNNITLNNDDLIGNNDDSMLIVKNTSSVISNGVISGHLYYDVNNGGGIDVTDGTGIIDIGIVQNIYIPPTNEELLADCGIDIVINPFIVESKLDFDGVDDYLSTPKFVDGLTNLTLMAWVKSDLGNSTNMTIAGEDTGCKLWLQNGSQPRFTIKASGISEKVLSSSAIKLNEWHHLTGSYNSSTGVMKLYVDGVLVNSTNIGVTGAAIANTASSNGNFEIGRRSSNVANREYFKGDIDEVRVFNKVLTDDQIQRMVYQEIQNNGGVIKGTVINKNVVDITTNATVSWSDLLAYYTMTDIFATDRTTDYSINNRPTKLHNITSFQEQTAPMPYETKADGAWATEGTWLHGNVWDIEDVANNKDWSIVQIKNNVTTSNTSKTIGLYIDANKTLTVNGDNLVQNSWYLELNGTLDLKNDSQLVQTVNSDLVTSATGKIMRRQEGAASFYWYNYWGSPVGAIGITPLTNNNSASNNANNAKFKANMLKDHVPAAMQFSNAYNALGKLSTRWMYKFQSGVTYYDWAHVNPNTDIAPGVGYIHKGTGTSNPSQQYVFEGKPNNGTILINVTDKGGPGSAQNTTYTTSLFGNPYPSALDIHKFIDDNQGVIGGSIQLWQQWSGATHNLYEYDGGYAVVNKLGGVRAYQFVGMEGATNGSQDGTKTPTRYLPVAQGFVVEIVADGVVEFNNDQRVFIKEADADGSYENGSTFFRTNGNSKGNGNEKDKGNGNGNSTNTSNRMKKLRVELKSVTGPETRRELLLGFSDETTDGFDYGYDAINTEVYNSDLNLNLEGESYTMLAYSQITDDKVIPLNFKSSGAYSFEIKITEYDNIDPNQKIFLRDNLKNTYASLNNSKVYTFNSEVGEFNNRFEIVFQPQQQSLSTEESGYQFNLIFYNNTTKNLHVKGLDSNVDNLYIINMQGQNAKEFFDLQPETLSKGLSISGLSTGVYIVYFKSGNATKTKKILID
ncbi:putative secreted protein (Por secretion system target) [Flavobacteriaceae bacterium MAR_2010_72]|nr:putative secreted protein (Por secretion system target) [Flavobacteriaceae bacterium MAR_2010_72]